MKIDLDILADDIVRRNNLEGLLPVVEKEVVRREILQLF